ncbi:MAG: hypothetical protein EBS79_07745 [Gammaproteobacteria bacterium]|nr:hypothetical protein [Gammaproteobacteria bacterium]
MTGLDFHLTNRGDEMNKKGMSTVLGAAMASSFASQMMKNPEMNCGAMMEQAKKSPQEESKAMEGKCAGMNMGQPATSK